ncbi:MAG: hypothetical protein KAS96_04545, partial [Planctomycetes bacterium]|nr:hypothetical protein [Planctomycetota bacterium]
GKFLKTDFAKSTQKQPKNCQNDLQKARSLKFSAPILRKCVKYPTKSAQINQIPLPKSPKNLLNYLR